MPTSSSSFVASVHNTVSPKVLPVYLWWNPQPSQVWWRIPLNMLNFSKCPSQMSRFPLYIYMGFPYRFPLYTGPLFLFLQPYWPNLPKASFTSNVCMHIHINIYKLCTLIYIYIYIHELLCTIDRYFAHRMLYTSHVCSNKTPVSTIIFIYIYRCIDRYIYR